MKEIPVEILDMIESISTLKVLLAFSKKFDENFKINLSLVEISELSGISHNSVRVALRELVAKEIILKERGQGRATNIYILNPSFVNPKVGTPNIGLSTVDDPNIGTPKVGSTSEAGEWKKSVGARKKKQNKLDQEDVVKQDSINNNIYNINNINLSSLNLYTQDINSIPVENPYKYIPDKDLGSLASKILNEYYYSTVPDLKSRPQHWYIFQMRSMKELLKQYRVEQIVAMLKYWTEINRPADGLTNLKFLLLRQKGGKRTNGMEALDYFKHEYLRNAAIYDQGRNQERITSALAREEEAKQELERQKQEVEQMSNEDFLKGLWSSFGAINTKKE